MIVCNGGLGCMERSSVLKMMHRDQKHCLCFCALQGTSVKVDGAHLLLKY